jgi:hypothetical protein
MQTLFQRTQEIEAAGGMLTVRGNRRRTPGGVYFFLVKEIMTPEQEEAVLATRMSTGAATAQAAAQSQAGATQSRASTRPACHRDQSPSSPKRSRAHEGHRDWPPQADQEAQQLRHGCVGAETAAGHATGLPPIPDTANATIAVFIADKQWPRVEQALRQRPARRDHRRGLSHHDPKHQLTGFWAQSCTTKGLQRAKRTPRPYE